MRFWLQPPIWAVESCGEQTSCACPSLQQATAAVSRLCSPTAPIEAPIELHRTSNTSNLGCRAQISCTHQPHVPQATGTLCRRCAPTAPREAPQPQQLTMTLVAPLLSAPVAPLPSAPGTAAEQDQINSSDQQIRSAGDTDPSLHADVKTLRLLDAVCCSRHNRRVPPDLALTM